MIEEILNGIYYALIALAIGLPICSRMELSVFRMTSFCWGLSLLIGHFMGMK